MSHRWRQGRAMDPVVGCSNCVRKRTFVILRLAGQDQITILGHIVLAEARAPHALESAEQAIRNPIGTSHISRSGCPDVP